MGKRKSTNVSQNQIKEKRNRKTVTQNNNDSDEDEEVNNLVANSSHDETNLSARSGKILTVKLRNFMCHSNLTVDFNPRTNLLIGQNGSGKSAILTALIIGLGSKANATNRSSSIKDLIKTGESSAQIEVHISNNGSDAYEYEKYGDRIIVVRSVAASGASTYKLKNATGANVSTSRADLLKLILYMNIQVDNPVCVMTQDASRSFLRDSNPKKRYELFLKATQLDVIIEKLNASVAQWQQAQIKFNAQKRTHQKLKETQKNAQEKLHQFQSMEPLKKETNRYKSERAWLAVVQEEEFAQAANTEFENTRRKRDQCEEKLAKCNVTDNEATEQNVRLSGEIEHLQQQLSDERKKLDAEKVNYRKTMEQITNNERNVKRLEAKINKVKDTIKTLEENIQSEMNTNKNHIEEMKQKNENELDELNKTLRDCESTLKTHRRELDIYTNTQNKCKSQMQAAKRDQIALNEEKRNLETRLRQLHASPKENIRSFGEQMVRLVDSLDQHFKQGKFKKMPIGPIGNFVEVKKAVHRQYVEDALGDMLLAFCVDNNDDLLEFREIVKKMSFNGPLPVICSPFLDHSYDVTGKCVQSDANSVRLMDLIVVDNPVVMNCLIDQCMIETILFTKSLEYATHITSKKENVPRNLYKVVLLDPYSEYFPAPNFRSYSKRPRQSRNLRVNEAEREKAYENDIMKIKGKIEAANVELIRNADKIKENDKLQDEQRKFIAELEAKLRMLRLSITEKESIEYPEEVDVEVMQNEVTEQTKILDSLKIEYEAENGRMEGFNANAQEFKEKIVELKRQLQNIETEIHGKQKSKDDICESLSKRDSLVAYYRKNKKTLTDAMTKYELEMEKIRDKLARLVTIAQKTGPRIEPKHTDEQLTKLIKQNETKLNAVNTSNETLEIVMRQAEEAELEEARCHEILNAFKDVLKMTHESIKMRMSNVSKLKQFMITRTSLYFTEIMKLRDIDGTLNYDNEARTLDIQVIPRDKECANAVSKTTNLSGGERSYTTVAFLLSLWSCVDHPFYFLDEYDVFTDQVNRMFMTRLLLNEAQKKPLQYTFLTPQDTSEIVKSKDLSILRLENPDR